MTFDGPSFVRNVAQRLIQEFQFSQGAGTSGLIGAAKEHPARVQLERLMPGPVKVGSGIVVDSYGGTSRQQDIVIYEDLCPVFTHNDTPEATYYPIEGVVAVGEVKSGLGKSEIADAVANCASVKRLRRHVVTSDHGLGTVVDYRFYGSTSAFAAVSSNQYDQDRKSLDQVFSFILCQRFAASEQTTLQNFVQEYRSVGLPLSPNMAVSLESGGIYPCNFSDSRLVRSATEGNTLIYSDDSIGGFAQLVKSLRLYCLSGRTVHRVHYERYFLPIGSSTPGLPIKAGVPL